MGPVYARPPGFWALARLVTFANLPITGENWQSCWPQLRFQARSPHRKRLVIRVPGGETRLDWSWPDDFALPAPSRRRKRMVVAPPVGAVLPWFLPGSGFR